MSERIDKELEKIIQWKPEQIELFNIFESDAKCDIGTKKRLLRRNELALLLKISRAVDVFSILNRRDSAWHITPIFYEEIAIRNMGISSSVIGYKLINQGDGRPVDLKEKIITLFRHAGTITDYIIPGSPPIIPGIIIKIAKQIKSFQKKYHKTVQD